MCRGKRITITIYKEEYKRAIARVRSRLGRKMKTIRQSTVEPVYGRLTQYMGMRKVNTRGIHQANKVMLLSATAYNLKKLLKYSEKRLRKVAQVSKSFDFSQNDIIRAILNLLKPLKKLDLDFEFK